MSAFRFFALAGTLVLHLLVVFWIVSRPAGSLPSRSERPVARVLPISLIVVSPDQTAIAPPLIRQEVIQELVRPQDMVAPSPVAASRDTHQPGLIPDYYPAKELSRMPVGLTDLNSLYPAAAPGTVAGKLRLRLWVNESGQIDRLAAMESDLPENIEQMMLASFRKMLFKPGEINNIPVKVWVDIVIEYGEHAQAEDTSSIEIKKVFPPDAAR